MTKAKVWWVCTVFLIMATSTFISLSDPFGIGNAWCGAIHLAVAIVVMSVIHFKLSYRNKERIEEFRKIIKRMDERLSEEESESKHE